MVPGVGPVQLETTRLVPRAEPYHLHVELARHRLMRISFKREEWGLFDYPGMDDLAAQVEEAREEFVRALEHTDHPRQAAQHADRSLASAVDVSEKIARFHAGVFLNRRVAAGGFTRQFLGTAIQPAQARPPLLRRAAEALDYVRIPFSWREVQPKESVADFAAVDEAVKAAGAARLSVRGGPLLSFGMRWVPDWMYIWENDYESILEYAREHVRRCVSRHATAVSSWVVASGLHAEGVFSFSFEQVIDLTRAAVAAVRAAAPKAGVTIELAQPFGEYYARNQRTLPPLLYAEMLVQSGVPFDAFGLQFICGIDADGFHVRDLMQISSLIDRLANLGKPIHVSAVAAPSAATDTPTGWRGPWSEETQAEFLVALTEIALSKPYVESVCAESLMDGPACAVPHGGVLREDGHPKPAFTQLAALHRRLASEPAR